MQAENAPADTGTAVCSQRTVPPASLHRLRRLRLSVTDRCNYRCLYCMPKQGVPSLACADLLPLEEMARHVAWLCSYAGIESVKLTGGEPLVRKGISGLIEQLAALPAIREVSLTTNGSLLASMAEDLMAAGLRRVNISLDSLDADRFTEITRGGRLQHTLEGIAAAQQVGLTPIKLNTVLRRSTWKQEMPALLDYAAGIGAEIRFIELMRMGTERAWCGSEFVSIDEVRNRFGTEILLEDRPGSAPAQRTLLGWKGSIVTVGWITPRSHPFCRRCDRLRMDARGLLRRCLMDSATLDLPHLLSTMDGHSARRGFARYIAGKVQPRTMESPFAMSQIGG
jgi:cyclic pyranopterin phosphate synthase